MANLLATKPLNLILAEAHETGEHSLRRALGPTNLITLGIGAIIGTGIFVITGAATAEHAGPAIVLSFVFAAVGCVFAGLCYAEFASMIPVAGSAYTYGYATLGEPYRPVFKRHKLPVAPAWPSLSIVHRRRWACETA